VSEEKTKQIQGHFCLPEAHWKRFKRKLASQGQGYSASSFLREKILEFLQEEASATSPLANYRRVYCDGCPYGDACKSDKTLEMRCLLASLALSPSRLAKKRFWADAQL